VDQVAAAVHYPASGGYVACRYAHHPERAAIDIELTGSGEACACHVLLPDAARSVLSEAKNLPGSPPHGDLPFEMTRVERSRYVDFAVDLPGPHRICIQYGSRDPA
jgi:hypothetical protein